MPDDPRVTLVFDPFEICDGGEARVGSFIAEKRAFREIEQLLMRDPRYDTVQLKTYVIDNFCWQHFRTYCGVQGVRIEEVTPRTRLRDWIGVDPPEWLHNQDICRWDLLNRERPASLVSGDWATTIAAWLVPGINDAGTLSNWLRLAACAVDFPVEVTQEPLRAWFRKSLLAVANCSIGEKDVVDRLAVAMAQSLSPAEFARLWLRRKALHPLAEYGAENLLQLPGLNVGSPLERTLTRHIPLVFPLPEHVHREVCECMRRAVRTARVQHPNRFEDAVLRLNALWDGLAEELQTWLEIQPRGMTLRAAAHLQQLPGFSESDPARRLVQRYTPPEPVRTWQGLEDDFDGWVANYAGYLRHCFVRRELPEADDPAANFGRWLREHYGVSYTHPERGYCRLARQVRESLQRGRAVVVVMIDALALHLLQECSGYLKDHLKEEPTWSSHLLAPVPTITEVCKQAILTGFRPNQCNGSLSSLLCQAYDLTSDQVQISASWQDGDRLQIGENTRLVVHRDNQLDDHVHHPSHKRYEVLLEESAGVFRRLAELVARWVGDFVCLNQSPPVVLLTADHGFTYGPALGSETRGHQQLDGLHRCVALPGKPAAQDLTDESLVYLDKDRLSLAKSYLAAIGRHFGRDTVSGWAMSHGGLLPEEVIIPALEWFGDRTAAAWPTVTFPDGALFDAGKWQLTIRLQNDRSLPVYGGTLHANVVGNDKTATRPFARIEPGLHASIDVAIPGENIPEGVALPVEVTIWQRLPRASTELDWIERYQVPRAKQLIERTVEQADFENMF